MKKVIALLLFIGLSSCSIFVNRSLKRAGVFEKHSKLHVIANNKQKIVFMGMHHVGVKEFYNDVAHKVDSLQQLNYTVFYEDVSYNKNNDSLTLVKNHKKLRKLMGVPSTKYYDTVTNLIYGRYKYRGKHKLINQPRYLKLNVDTTKVVWADVHVSELVTIFEKHHTAILLDGCDAKYNLNDASYDCKKVNKRLRKIFKNDYVLKYRNKHLAKTIVNSNKVKVLVLYGEGHFWGLYNELKSLDKNFRITKF